MSDFVLSAVLELRDRMTSKIRTAARGFDSVRSMAGSASSSVDRASNSMNRAGSAAGRLQQNLNRLHGNHDITINARDNASQRVSRIRQELSSLTGRTYTATVNIAQRGSALVGRTMGGLSEAANGMMLGAGMQMMGMAGVGYGVVDTINTYKNFEKQMAAVKAISTSDMGTAEAAAAMERLTAKAREMGSVTQFSATEAAKAFEYMGMAGWNVEQMISGIPAVLNLALASGEDLASVSDIVTDAMTALKIDTRGADADKNIQHFTDVLAAAATHSNTNVAMMGEAFKYAAAPAGLFADSYENAANVSNDVALALGLMANSGIKASQAGTALRSTLSRMTADTIPTANAMRMLGVDITQVGKDGTEQLKPLRAIFDDLRQKMKEGVSAESLVNYAETLSGTKTRNKQALMDFANKMAAQGGKLSAKDQAKFAKMFAGEEALSGWLAIMTATDQDYQNLIKAIDESEGTAAKMASTRANTLAGDFDILKSAWEDLQIELMTGPASDGLRDFLKGLQTDINKFKGYISDGFDISDVGKLAIDVITQLKDKFLELDGIGSILAGGALAAGLYKIAGIAGNVAGKIRDLVKGPAGNINPSTVGEIASNVNNMVVHARTVIINGRVSGAGEAGTAAGASGGSGKRQPRPARGMTGRRASAASEVAEVASTGSRLASVGKILGKLATPLMVAAGAWEAYNISQENSEAEQAANEQLRTAITPEEIQAATAYQKQVETEGTNHMGAAIGGTGGALAGGLAGAQAGAAIGTLAGGPIGTAIGGAIGGIGGAIAGSELGSAIGSHASEIKAYFSDAFSSIGDIAQNEWQYVTNTVGTAVQGVKDKWNGIASWFDSTVWQPVSNGAIMGINFIVGAAALIGQSISEALSPIAEWINTNVWTPIKETASSAWQEISTFPSVAATAVSTIWSEVSSWLDLAVWQPISTAASNAWITISTVAGETWAAITSFYAPAASWFDSTVWQPISTAVSTVESAIVNAFSAAWSAVTGLWASAGAWFESNVIAPIRDKFNAVASIGASITGLGVPGHAIGTSFFEGGFTEINEHGGEIIDLPQGSRIYPHATTMEMLENTFGEMANGFLPHVSDMSSMLGRVAGRMAIEANRSQQSQNTSSPSITISGNEFVVREDADIDRIAHKLFQLIEQSAGNYQWTGA